MIKQVALSSDKSKLLNETNQAAAKDVALQVTREINHQVRPLSKVVSKGKAGLIELKEDYTHLKNELEFHRTEAKERIIGIKNRLNAQIDAATIETIGSVVSSEFGVEDNKATGYILLSRVNSVLSE